MNFSKTSPINLLFFYTIQFLNEYNNVYIFNLELVFSVIKKLTETTYNVRELKTVKESPTRKWKKWGESKNECQLFLERETSVLQRARACLLKKKKKRANSLYSTIYLIMILIFYYQFQYLSKEYSGMQ